jgi:quercetin dioxygenase-like cupin family protein
MHRMRTALAAAAAVLGVITFAPGASATPPSGVSGVILHQYTYAGKDYILREITVQPGGYTGWHYHDGTIYALVRSGTLTHYDNTCAVDGVYHAGQALTEPAGPAHAHLTRNETTEPVVFDALYVLTAGSPLSEDVPAPC